MAPSPTGALENIPGIQPRKVVATVAPVTAGGDDDQPIRFATIDRDAVFSRRPFFEQNRGVLLAVAVAVQIKWIDMRRQLIALSQRTFAKSMRTSGGRLDSVSKSISSAAMLSNCSNTDSRAESSSNTEKRG